MRKKELLSLNVNAGRYEEFVGHILQLAEERKSRYACFANVHMLIEGYHNPIFANTVNRADITAPDGKALAWAMRLLYGIPQDRVAGMDIVPDMLQQAEERNLSVFFYGGSEELISKTKLFVAKKYPSLITAGFYSPPFQLEQSWQEQNLDAQRINKSGANIVFVVLGCPKQERWMASMAGRVNAVMLGIGGALAVTIGMQKRAPKWMQDYCLEWFYRLMQEPRRLFKRYASTNPLFVYLLLKEYVRIKFFRKNSAIIPRRSEGLIRLKEEMEIPEQANTI